MDTLPVEIQDLILGFVGGEPISPLDIIHASLVCTTWAGCMAPARERLSSMWREWISVWVGPCLDEEGDGLHESHFVVRKENWKRLGECLHEIEKKGRMDYEIGSLYIDMAFMHERSQIGEATLYDVCGENNFIDFLYEWVADVMNYDSEEDVLFAEVESLIERIRDDNRMLLERYKKVTKGLIQRILCSTEWTR